jgi:hypothetical protein
MKKKINEFKTEELRESDIHRENYEELQNKMETFDPTTKKKSTRKKSNPTEYGGRKMLLLRKYHYSVNWWSVQECIHVKSGF